MSAGRPTDYRPEYCELVIKLGEDGQFPVEWAAQIGVAKKTMHRWKEEFPEFCHAYDLAFTKSESFHMMKSRGHANNGTGSPALVKWLGSAVFGYKESTEVENTLVGKDGGAIQHSLSVVYVDPPKE